MFAKAYHLALTVHLSMLVLKTIIVRTEMGDIMAKQIESYYNHYDSMYK